MYGGIEWEYLERSEKDLVRFLESRPIVIPQEEARSISVLLSDSKGARLEQAQENNLPLVFLCKRGASTKDLVDLLLQKLPLLLQEYKKLITVYFWGGTCDITKKQGKYIQIRGKATDIIPAIVEELHRAKDFVLSQNCRIKFIGIPVYLISLYNDIKEHRNPTVFLDSDTEVESQVDLLNQHIEQINLQLGRNTLKFNADLRDTRRGKKRYFFKLLPDGLRSGCLLAQKWLRGLELDIVRECYPPQKILWKLTSRNSWHFNRMSDLEENGNNVRKGNEGAADSGVISDRADDSSWLHKTLESFSFSFDEQQRMQREVFMRTMDEMKETTNQEIARQQAQFQQFLENSKEQIIEAVRTPLFASTPMPLSSSGMMRTGQNPTSSDYDYPSTPRSHATSGWTPSSQQSSSANQPSNGGNASNQGTIDRRFEEPLRVIEAREEQHPSPYGPSSRSNSRSLEQGSLQRGLQTKLPTYDCQDDIDVFLVPFERIAERYAWSEIEKIDRLYESLKGKAMWYVCSLPRAMTANYRSLRDSLTKRFGRKDPPFHCAQETS